MKEKHWYNWPARHISWLANALRTAWLDVKNFRLFRKEMFALAADPKSKFRQLGLKVSKSGNIVYLQRVLSQEQENYLDDRQKALLLRDLTMQEHEYLFTELMWGEYLITQFHDFEDENGTPSCCHGITFTFRPLVIDNWKIWRAVILWIIGLSLFTWTVIVKHWDTIWPFITGLF